MPVWLYLLCKTLELPVQEGMVLHQQRELLYIPFFIWYVLEWLALLIKYRDRMQAYRHIRFEEEAYNHQADLCYLKNRKRYRYK